MYVYDSLYDSVDEDTLKSIKFLFKNESIKVQMSEVQKQCGDDMMIVAYSQLPMLFNWLRNVIQQR